VRLDAGSITSGFGTIDNGATTITTKGTINFGSLADGTITVTGFVDEDNMSSDSATLIPTQQSVKAYVATIAGQSNNIVGLSASADELNILDDATVTTAELNILDGSATTQATVTLAATDGVVISDADVMKQCLVSDFDTFMASTTKTLTNKTLTSPTLDGTIVVSDGSNDFNIASHDGSNGLKLGGTLVTASAAELNILDGDTSATSTTVADADRVVMNDNGTMVQVAVTDLAAYFDDEITAMPNLVTTAATTVGALNSGSITSGFGAIDNGSSASTTTGLISGGSLAIGGANVTSTAAELNYLDITTLGTSQASKAVTADANGVVTFDNGIIEESTTITSSSNAATLNLRDGTNFLHDLTENVTYTFSNPAASGKVSSFTLKVIQDSTARTITWPSSVDWAAATAPTITTTNNGVDIFVVFTNDGRTTYYGFTAGQAMG